MNLSRYLEAKHAAEKLERYTRYELDMTNYSANYHLNWKEFIDRDIQEVMKFLKENGALDVKFAMKGKMASSGAANFIIDFKSAPSVVAKFLDVIRDNMPGWSVNIYDKYQNVNIVELLSL